MSNFPGTWQVLSHREMITEQGIMEESVDQKLPLGAKLELADGRVFRYCKNGAGALAAGKTLQSVIVATERDDAINAAAAVTTGSTSFLFTAVGAMTKDQFAEGFAHIVNDTGVGLQYKIKGHDAVGAGSDVTINLYDPIVTALAATTDVILSSNQYRNVLLAADDLAFIIGVPTIPVTANYYFWAQSGGIGMVLQNGSTGVATTERECYADAAGGTDGAVLSTAASGAGIQKVGLHLFDTTDVVTTEYWPINLTIDK